MGIVTSLFEYKYAAVGGKVAALFVAEDGTTVTGARSGSYLTRTEVDAILDKALATQNAADPLRAEAIVFRHATRTCLRGIDRFIFATDLRCPHTGTALHATILNALAAKMEDRTIVRIGSATITIKPPNSNQVVVGADAYWLKNEVEGQEMAERYLRSVVEQRAQGSSMDNAFVYTDAPARPGGHTGYGVILTDTERAALFDYIARINISHVDPDPYGICAATYAQGKTGSRWIVEGVYGSTAKGTIVAQDLLDEDLTPQQAQDEFAAGSP